MNNSDEVREARKKLKTSGKWEWTDWRYATADEWREFAEDIAALDGKLPVRVGRTATALISHLIREIADLQKERDRLSGGQRIEREYERHSAPCVRLPNGVNHFDLGEHEEDFRDLDDARNPLIAVGMVTGKQSGVFDRKLIGGEDHIEKYVRACAAINAALTLCYQTGLERGRDMLGQLARGEISEKDFNAVD